MFERLSRVVERPGLFGAEYKGDPNVDSHSSFRRDRSSRRRHNFFSRKRVRRWRLSPTPNEAGATYHPEHASKRSRADIDSDLNSAMKQPAWNAASRGAPWPVAKTGEPKSRAQVVAELDVAMKHPAWNSVSRGAPWPPVLNNPK